MKEGWKGPLEKVDDYRWRIPRDYQPGMRVPGMIYADERLLKDIKKEQSLNQVANVATLPGIVKYSLAMPDIHWGYGMPIGGVAATDVEEGGVIGAGLVGYDINCLSGNSFILNELGYRIQIKHFQEDFYKRNLTCMDFNKEKAVSTEIAGFLKQKPKTAVLNVLTATGRQITATEDHPFYTKDGMRKLGDLSIGDEVAIYPFEGVDYEEPNSEAIIDVEDIRKLLLRLGKGSRGSALAQVLNHLKKKNILPLRYDSPQLPYLLKVIGYCFGDGTVYFSGKGNKGVTCFYGEKEDLEQIKKDIAKAGFEKAGIYSRHRHHKIRTMYSVYEFDRNETWLKVASSSFAVLMAVLGTPMGNKCRQPYGLPKWLFKAPLWQKRLFLAGLFGAELSSPKTMTGHGYNFYCPTLSMNKTQDCMESGREFLEEIASLLSEFGVYAHRISQRKEYVNKQGVISYRFRLMALNTTKNLLNLYSKVGFEYNEKRKFLANIAIQYLNLKDRIITEKKEVAALVPKLVNSGSWDKKEIFNYLTASPYINERFIERSLYEPRKTKPRMWGENPTFDEFASSATIGLGHCGMAWDRIDLISNIDFDDWVYDFTVKHPHHNFVANGFVVSNCGVRMMRTNLELAEVQPRLTALVNGLFSNVPCGVGVGGKIKTAGKDEENLLVKGARWAVERGYGWKQDLEVTEECGALKGADPSKLSERALERGRGQAGTLGSGNHFVEIQVIDEIYDEQICSRLNLARGLITIMIHSGSRGLGYQVCDDYAKSMVRSLAKYNISVPDRQLACVPVNSPEGKSYAGAMACAANYAWVNRQCLMHLTREVFERIFNKGPKELGMDLIYDVAHNIAKFEKHKVNGKEKLLCVHRKGATRAFPAGHPDIPAAYKEIGQPVIIPGDMGRNSYLLTGTENAMKETFGTVCHGAGRVMSRTAAVRSIKSWVLEKELKDKGIIVRARGRGTLAEEAPQAYKNVNDVVGVVHNAGIGKKICRMRPLGVIKG
ncbi:MAG: intein-containing RctB family protein [Candidatus Omnitrophota bacterium]|nr:intein-containing RctB family protein [Candidatus Omnitrophota bacterium]